MAAKRISSLLNLPSSNQEPKVTIPEQEKRRSSEQLSSPSYQSFSKRFTRALHERAPSGQPLSPLADPPPSLPSSSNTGFSSNFKPPESEASSAKNLSPSAADGVSQLVLLGSRPSSRAASPILEHAGDGRANATSPPPLGTKGKRLNWLPGRSRSGSRVGVENTVGPSVWIIEQDGKLPYDLTRLLAGDTVPELWVENGDTYVYLFPQHSGKGPSFRIHSSLYNASSVLIKLANTGGANGRMGDGNVDREQGIDGMTPVWPFMPPGPQELASPGGHPEIHIVGTSGSLAVPGQPSEPVSKQLHLHLPLALGEAFSASPAGEASVSDIDTLVAIRNTFAFLLGQSLVATERDATLFDVFLKISDVLTAYAFSNIDGSTYGEVAATSFDFYVDELGLADVRASAEKNIEAIVLGERMKSIGLYNEAFVHGVGKYEDIKNVDDSKFHIISPLTRNRMERASMDLSVRLKNINARLEEFEFPAIFAGIMNSRTADERKIIRFDEWKASFMSTRKHVLNYYKRKYGSWPPKASSKKNDLETSGLNRLVLKELYQDFSNLYSLLVDRSSLTTRTADGVVESDGASDLDGTVRKALRTVLSEYDHSLPPVQPAVPFDTPLQPSPASLWKNAAPESAKKDARLRSKKLKNEEFVAVLQASHNVEDINPCPFVDVFYDHERKNGLGKTIDELCDLRNGQWIFLYAVLQALPMLVVDAPALKWTDGVEYFLCQPPRSGVPWAREDTGIRKSWYGIAGSSGVVSLPADIVEHGVEGIYRRSHCWQMAEKWSSQNAMGPRPPILRLETSFAHHPGTHHELSATLSSANRRSIMDMGLEALPLPAGAAPASPIMRPHAVKDPTKTFDAIIGEPVLNTKSKKKK